MKSAMASLGEDVGIQPWRHISIAISRKYLRKGEGRFRMDEEDMDSDGEDDDVEDMQAGHGTHVAGIVYARSLRPAAMRAKTTGSSGRGASRRAGTGWSPIAATCFIRAASSGPTC